MCKENKKEEKLFNKDADKLHDLIEDALNKWYDVNNDDKFESTEMIVPMVFKRFLVSHFVFHFEVSEESINHYLQILKDMIYSHVEKDFQRIQEEKNTMPLTQKAIA
tara:strand:- start:287 stop:607 length:321 start_codon:yes stop_codon:yes gene_type:complete